MDIPFCSGMAFSVTWHDGANRIIYSGYVDEAERRTRFTVSP